VELEITEREWTFEMCVWLERERETDRQRQRDLVQWRELAGGMFRDGEFPFSTGEEW